MYIQNNNVGHCIDVLDTCNECPSGYSLINHNSILVYHKIQYTLHIPIDVNILHIF